LTLITYAKLQSLEIPYNTQKGTNTVGCENIHFCVWHSIRNNPNFAFGIKLSERMRFVKIKSPYAIRKQT